MSLTVYINLSDYGERGQQDMIHDTDEIEAVTAETEV